MHLNYPELVHKHQLDQAGLLNRFSKCYRRLVNLQVSMLVRSLNVTNQIAVFVTPVSNIN